MKEYISKLISGNSLTKEESAECMKMILNGEATQSQMASFLTALRIKGETADEIIGCAEMMKQMAETVNPATNKYIDFVGTGGDGTNTFNISTVSSIVTAAAGVTIAKHGNRASSSKSGSSDCLEALGVNIMLSPKQVEECVNEVGIGFMNAQVFHKSMKNVAAVRREMGIRTIFNMLGPLSNPSDSKMQVIGVFSRSMVEVFANVMVRLGVKRALVLNGLDGMDEITNTTKTYIGEINNGEISYFELDPKDYGFEYAMTDDIVGGDGSINAQIAMNILKGEKSKKLDIVLLNSGAAIYIGGKAESIGKGIEIARKTIESGAALLKLNELIEKTNSFGGAA